MISKNYQKDRHKLFIQIFDLFEINLLDKTLLHIIHAVVTVCNWCFFSVIVMYSFILSRKNSLITVCALLTLRYKLFN